MKLSAKIGAGFGTLILIALLLGGMAIGCSTASGRIGVTTLDT
jgi:hypothetical protein